MHRHIGELVLFVFFDARLSHINKDYLLTYLLTYLITELYWLLSLTVRGLLVYLYLSCF